MVFQKDDAYYKFASDAIPIHTTVTATTLKVYCSKVASEAAELSQCSWAMKVQILHNSASPRQERHNQQHQTLAKKQAGDNKCNQLLHRFWIFTNKSYFGISSATNYSSGLIFIKIRAESGRIFNKYPGKNPGEMLICKEKNLFILFRKMENWTKFRECFSSLSQLFWINSE